MLRFDNNYAQSREAMQILQTLYLLFVITIIRIFPLHKMILLLITLVIRINIFTYVHSFSSIKNGQLSRCNSKQLKVRGCGRVYVIIVLEYLGCSSILVHLSTNSIFFNEYDI